MIRFSIVIPVYKAENTISRCVESIEKNTYRNFEIILVEDGSPDNSWRVCSDLARKYTNIRALRNEKNRGVSFSRNRGISVAQGEYTMFVDSDDWVDPFYYENFSKVIDSNRPFFAICGYINHDEKMNSRTDICGWEDESTIQIVSLYDTLHSLFEKTLLQQLWNKAFRTELIHNMNIQFDERISIGEDFRFILDYLKFVPDNQVVLINKPLYHYMRDQSGSLMYHVGYESVEEPLANLKKLYALEQYSPEEIEELMKVARTQQIDSYAYLIMHNAGMKLGEKKKLIYNLDKINGKSLYRQNYVLYIKERIAGLVKRLKLK